MTKGRSFGNSGKVATMLDLFSEADMAHTQSAVPSLEHTQLTRVERDNGRLDAAAMKAGIAGTRTPWACSTRNSMTQLRKH